MKLRNGQFARDVIRLHYAEVGDDGDRPFSRQAKLPASVAAVEMADRRQKIQLLDEGASRLLQNEDNFLGATCNFRCAACTGQTRRRLFVIADHGRVDIRKAIDLRGTEESDVHAATLQPV